MCTACLYTTPAGRRHPATPALLLPWRLQSAHQQVVVALVHAAEGIQPGDALLLLRATAAMQSFAFAPLTTALQQQQQQDAGPVLGGAAARLQSALRQVQALLGALELYQVYADDQPPGDRPGSPRLQRGAGEEQAAGAAALQRGAVEAFLSCWQWLGEICLCAVVLGGWVCACVHACLSVCVLAARPTAAPHAAAACSDVQLGPTLRCLRSS